MSKNKFKLSFYNLAITVVFKFIKTLTIPDFHSFLFASCPLTPFSWERRGKLSDIQYISPSLAG